MPKQRVVLGTDHAAYELKETLKQHCVRQGIDVVDVGTFSQEPDDYPDIAVKVAGAVLGEKLPGVFCCGTGIGASIACNKHPGIRAARCCTVEDARLARAHNDANVLCMGGRTIDPKEAVKLLDTFLTTDFEGGRHKRRVDKLDSPA